MWWYVSPPSVPTEVPWLMLALLWFISRRRSAGNSMSTAYRDWEATVSFFEREVNFCCQFSLVAVSFHMLFFHLVTLHFVFDDFCHHKLLKTRKWFCRFDILFCSAYAPAVELVLSNSFRVKCRSLQLQILSGLNRKLNENFTSHTLRTYS